MLNEQEAQQLIIEFIDLREKAKKSKEPEDLLKFQKHERICIEKFSYLVTMKTGKYKQFSNYEDLNQEGMEALVKGMKNYDPKKGNAFWWFHRYIDTRISRSANLHTTIRYPLKVAKENTPHKESTMPLLVEDRYCPDKELESAEVELCIESAMGSLSDLQKSVINLAFGFSGDKPMSINKICQKLNISRSTCTKSLNSSLAILKDSIKI